MKIIGIDLSGPRNIADTSLVIFEQEENELRFLTSRDGIGDIRILEIVSELDASERIVIGIDAPLSYNPGGGDRPSDKELRKTAYKIGRVGVMPPTMMRMVFLTLRGINLTRGLEALKPDYCLDFVEVHPGACLLLRGVSPTDVANFKHDPAARGHILEWLATRKLKNIPHSESTLDHFVAACAGAYGAWQWALNKSVWLFPASPPEHPYDFAC
jgi:predicted nuclease with RNAse H fold